MLVLAQMFNLNFKKDQKRRLNRKVENQVTMQVRKILSTADQKLIVMVRG